MSSYARRIAASNLVRLELLEQIRAAFEAEGIPVLYLKGAAFLDTLYPNVGARPMGDVDILVRRRDFERAAELLEGKLGYTRDRGGPVVEQYYAWAFTRPGIVLELHRTLCRAEQFSVDYEELWARSIVRRGGGRLIPTLGPEDSLLHLAVHEAKHGYFVDERSAEDVRRVVHEWRPSWPVVVERARAWRMTLALYVTLIQSRRQAGTEVPLWVLEALRPAGLRRRLLEMVVDLEGPGRSRFGEPSRLALFATTLLTAEDPANLTRYAASFARVHLLELLPRLDR